MLTLCPATLLLFNVSKGRSGLQRPLLLGSEATAQVRVSADATLGGNNADTVDDLLSLLSHNKLVRRPPALGI